MSDTQAGQQAAALAAADTARTPQLVREAFVPVEPLRVGDLPLHPLTLATFMLLEQLGSPFRDTRFLQTLRENPDAISFADIAVAVYVLTRHTQASRAVLAKGRAAFDEAVAVFANDIPVAELQAIGAALGRHLVGAFSTVLPSAEKKNADGAGPVCLATEQLGPAGNGLGWGLTLLDAVLSEYGWTIEYAMEVPLIQAFALYAAMSARYDREFTGMTYAEQDIVRELSQPG